MFNTNKRKIDAIKSIVIRVDIEASEVTEYVSIQVRSIDV